MKIVTVVGTRPEIIRLSRVISVLDNNSNHILVHTGQNYDYELNEIFFNDLGIKQPDYYLDAAEENAAKTIGKIISKFDDLLAEIKPDALLLLGDTNSCLSVIPAKKRKIPVFHMEAGNRCFDQRVPEESNRILVDHLSDINMPYSKLARENLIREGIPTDRIIKTGSPMKEIISYYMNKINQSNVITDLGLNRQDYYVVSSHREENVDNDNNFSKLMLLLKYLSDDLNKKIIFTTHPRTRKRLDESNVEFNSNIVFSKPLNFTDYIYLQKNALAVLSDSGTISEESSILNFPALNIRETHERPEAMEEGAVILSGLNLERIVDSLKIINNQSRDESRLLKLVDDYNVDNVSHKVLRIIHSYTDYINSYVWKKNNNQN